MLTQMATRSPRSSLVSSLAGRIRDFVPARQGRRNVGNPSHRQWGGRMIDIEVARHGPGRFGGFMGSYIATLIVSVLVVLPALVLAQQPQGPTPPPMRSITRVTGDLYRVQNNDHYTVFLVTPAGIILADPINVDAAAWIKAQLAERFPNTPVRYVLYSHHHQDHASGAAVFNDTAELVAHQNFAAALKASATSTKRPRSGSRRWCHPNPRTHDRRTITLGGKRVDLIHPGRMGHAPDMTVLYFPAERVVFGVDFVNVKSVPGSNTLANGASIAEYVNALKVVDALDFDIVAPGHGPTGRKADLAAYRRYYEDLEARVAARIAKGTNPRGDPGGEDHGRIQGLDRVRRGQRHQHRQRVQDAKYRKALSLGSEPECVHAVMTIEGGDLPEPDRGRRGSSGPACSRNLRRCRRTRPE